MSKTGIPASATVEVTSVCAAASTGVQQMHSKGKRRLALDFNGQKAFAWAEGKHEFCPNGKCRKAKKCKGGPRGTFRRYGKPLCETEEVTRKILFLQKRAENRRREQAISNWLS